MTARNPAIPAARPPASPWSSTLRLALVAILALGLVLGWLGRRVALTVDGDDATYMALSHSLASGHYRDIFLVGAPPHAQYPPLYPAWLLLVRTVAGAGVGPAIAANLLLLSLVAFLVADGMRRVGHAALGLLAAATVVWNPALINLATQIRSELLFVACCAVALWCTLREGESGAPARYGPGSATAALASFLTRSAGLTLLPAVGCAWLLRRQWRRLAFGGVAAALVVGGWFGYTSWANRRTIGHSYATELAVGTAIANSEGITRHLVENARFYFVRAPVNQFQVPDLPGHSVDNGIEAALLVVLALAGAISLARRWAALPVFLFLTLLLLLVFPWGVSRLMTAMVPWIVIVVLHGTTRLAGGRAALALGLLLAALGLRGQVQEVHRRLACRTSAPYTDARCYDQEARGFMAAVAYVRDSLPATAVIASTKPSTVFAATGRLGFPLELFTDRETSSLLSPAGPTTEILLSRMLNAETERIAPRLLASCGKLSLLASFAPAVLVLSARNPAETHRPDACEAIRTFLKAPPANFDLAPG